MENQTLQKHVMDNKHSVGPVEDIINISYI